ncbi:MAG: hypothetical protein PHW74_13160 [Desulfobacca sp.]|nr:hypothetical protein [Desulfobacca sp.]
MWQSDRRTYSDQDIEIGNAIFEQLTRDHHPGWREFIWKIKEPPELKIV